MSVTPIEFCKTRISTVCAFEKCFKSLSEFCCGSCIKFCCSHHSLLDECSNFDQLLATKVEAVLESEFCLDLQRLANSAVDSCAILDRLEFSRVAIPDFGFCTQQKASAKFCSEASTSTFARRPYKENPESRIMNHECGAKSITLTNSQIKRRPSS